MIAVVPVAGSGTRLRPHTFTLPKAMLPVAGKPILGHILDTLRAAGARRVVLVTGFLGERIRAYAATRRDLNIQCIEQTEQLGLGHAIWVTREAVGDEPLLIILGDTLFEADLHGLTPDGPHRLGVRRVEDPRRFGVVELEGQRVRRVVEKPERPPSDLAIVGIYYLTSSRLLFDCLGELVRRGERTRGEIQLTDALQLMIERGETMEILPVEGWYDCGTPETLLQANRALLAAAPPPAAREGCVLVPPVSLDPACEVESAVIGPHVSIGPGARVRGSIVRDSIVSDGADVSGVLIESSIVGENAVVRGRFARLNVGSASEILES